MLPQPMPSRWFPARLQHNSIDVVAGLRLLRNTVTVGVAIFLVAAVLQKTAFDFGSASHPSARTETSPQPAVAAERGSASLPIGPFLGLLLTAALAGAIRLCRRRPRCSDHAAFPKLIVVVGLGFLAAMLYRLTSPAPDLGIIEVALCGALWFAAAVAATGSLDRIALEVGSCRAASQIRERGEYGVLIVLVALLAAVALVGIQAIASMAGLTISFQKTPELALLRTIAGESLIGVAIGAIVWVVAFRRAVQDLIYLASEPSTAGFAAPSLATSSAMPNRRGVGARRKYGHGGDCEKVPRSLKEDETLKSHGRHVSRADAV